MKQGPRWYRVVHLSGGTGRPLGRLVDVAPHPASLAPFVSRLLLDGAAGEVVLVEEATRRILVRYDLGRGPIRTNSRGPWRAGGATGGGGESAARQPIAWDGDGDQGTEA
jgi:hypothetical protein